MAVDLPLPSICTKCSVALEATFFLLNTLERISLEFVKLGLGVFKIFPRAFGTDIHAATGVGSPAVVSLVPEVIRVLIVDVLNSIVSLAEEPSLTLQSLRVAATQSVIANDMVDAVDRSENL